MKKTAGNASLLNTGMEVSAREAITSEPLVSAALDCAQSHADKEAGKMAERYEKKGGWPRPELAPGKNNSRAQIS